MVAVRRNGDDLILECLLQPRAGQDALAGEHNGALKIRISAPPVDGKANAALKKFLAGAFGVSKARVTIEAGETSRRKRVRIRAPGRIPTELTTLLAPHAP